jgi:hypothetical protein
MPLNLSLPLVFRLFAAQNAFSPPNLHQPQVFRVFAAQNAISPTNINPIRRIGVGPGKRIGRVIALIDDKQNIGGALHLSE